ncbi:diacylglycerol/lipid kinase family protein [Allonocardiopsis opalescens]|uniref:Undecaprenyl-diphosphatase n=1 Tax=Allonocardiopsis opalescens TaxID=1144618 RepID=A0A2T0PVC7_9ACTN|nr:diacylglycerol kinase family protein [Allonocardiopsis opalescens]PRX95481.1 undecaprenyl-diphosphatase [Allonocardiopsis opalescens]
MDGARTARARNGAAPGPEAADTAAVWALITAGLLASGRPELRRTALRAGLAVAVAAPAAYLVGRRMLRGGAGTAAWPASHAAATAAFAGSLLGGGHPALSLPAAGLAGATGYVRMYDHGHRPLDVLSGVALGGAAAVLAHRVLPGGPPVDSQVRVGEALRTPQDADGAGVVVVVDAFSGPDAPTGPADRAEAVATAMRYLLPMAEVVPVHDADGLADALDEAAVRAKVLAVAGGDIQAGDAAQAALRHGRPLLVLPVGPDTAFASALGLNSIEDAVHSYQRGRLGRVDVGEVDGRVFLNSAGIGEHPGSAAHPHPAVRLPGGAWTAEALALGRRLSTAEPFSLIIDGRRRQVWGLFVGNGRYHSDALLPSGRDRLEDGLLDIRVLEAAYPFPRARAVAAVLLNRLGLSTHYRTWFADTLSVQPVTDRMPLVRDGGAEVSCGPVTFRKQPRELRVFTGFGD